MMNQHQITDKTRLVGIIGWPVDESLNGVIFLLVDVVGAHLSFSPVSAGYQLLLFMRKRPEFAVQS